MHPPLPVLTVKMGKFKIKLDEGGFYQYFMALSMIMVTMMNSFLGYLRCEKFIDGYGNAITTSFTY